LPIGMGCLIAPCLVAVIALTGVWLGNAQSRKTIAFRLNCVVVQGRVLDLRVTSSPGVPDPDLLITSSEDDYLVKYQFKASIGGGPRTFEREASLSETDYHRLKPGSPVNVAYDPNDPSESRLEIESKSVSPLFLVVAGWSLVAISVFALAGAIVVRRRNRLLRQYGQKRQGHAVTCQATDHEDGGLVLQLNYRFASPTGCEITARAAAFRKDLTKDKAPLPNAPLVVLYYSDSIYQVL